MAMYASSSGSVGRAHPDRGRSGPDGPAPAPRRRPPGGRRGRCSSMPSRPAIWPHRCRACSALVGLALQFAVDQQHRIAADHHHVIGGRSGVAGSAAGDHGVRLRRGERRIRSRGWSCAHPGQDGALVDSDTVTTGSSPAVRSTLSRAGDAEASTTASSGQPGCPPGGRRWAAGQCRCGAPGRPRPSGAAVLAARVGRCRRSRTARPAQRPRPRRHVFWCAAHVPYILTGECSRASSAAASAASRPAPAARR